jgi:predicted aspartyl protease
MRVQGYGVTGTGEMILDRATGSFVQRLNLGPASETIGFDGKTAWFADATGLPIAEGNVDQRSSILAWSALFARPWPAAVTGGVVRFRGFSRAIALTVDRSSGLVQRAIVPRGDVKTIVAPSDYRTLPDGSVMPYVIKYTDDSGTWTGFVTRVSLQRSAPSTLFAQPVRPDDARISGGITSVQTLPGAPLIIIPARIDGGPLMHFILDTGGQNILTPDAMRRLGLQSVGGGTVGGGGANLISTRWANVRSVRVGAAEMTDQPFLVIDFGKLLRGIDGILGYELLARFAARLDYRTDTLQLASSIPASWIAGARAAPFTFRERQPQVGGAVDGIPAQVTIDTGSTGTFDVNAGFSRDYDLWKRYRVTRARVLYTGVGGGVKAARVRLASVDLGSLTLHGVEATLAQASAGFEADPSFAANAGEGIFREYRLVFDYAHRRLYFAPGGLRDRSGLTLTARNGMLMVSAVRAGAPAAGIAPGMRVTAVNGRAVSANDLQAVRAILDARAGTQVLLMLNGTVNRKILLRNYL